TPSQARPPSGAGPASLQRSRSDVDVNATATATARTRLAAAPSSLQFSSPSPPSSSSSPFSSASALPPGSYASLDESWSLKVETGRVRTKKQSSGTSPSVTDTRGRSRGKVVSQSQPGSRSGSPGRLLASTYGRVPRTSLGPAPSAFASTGPVPPERDRPRGHRSQGCSRETSPSRSPA
ncbi:hypothetical protein CRUP_016895, partial [Coryphaenoides rupestris]